MFDGHNVFFDEDATYGKCWGMKEYMEYTDTPLIIAAVECNHSPDGGRLSEYSPFSFTERNFGTIKGRGKITMDWMVGSFKPFIDQHFRTLSDRKHTFLAGSSMGGLMSLYGVLHYNKVFSRAAALSPSLWLSPDASEKMIKSSRPRKDTVIYMDYGSKEMKNHAKMFASFGKTANMLLEKGILLDCRIVPGGTHCEASWEKQIPFFIQTLLYEVSDFEK
jgi:predicted alpha/beta superfamily hydrolase